MSPVDALARLEGIKGGFACAATQDEYYNQVRSVLPHLTVRIDDQATRELLGMPPDWERKNKQGLTVVEKAQIVKDLKRDALLINGKLFPTEQASFDAVLHEIVQAVAHPPAPEDPTSGDSELQDADRAEPETHEVDANAGATNTSRVEAGVSSADEQQTVTIAQEVLFDINRTNSAGISLELLLCLCNSPALVMICPESQKIHPLEVRSTANTIFTAATTVYRVRGLEDEEHTPPWCFLTATYIREYQLQPETRTWLSGKRVVVIGEVKEHVLQQLYDALLVNPEKAWRMAAALVTQSSGSLVNTVKNAAGSLLYTLANSGGAVVGSTVSSVTSSLQAHGSALGSTLSSWFGSPQPNARRLSKSAEGRLSQSSSPQPSPRGADDGASPSFQDHI